MYAAGMMAVQNLKKALCSAIYLNIPFLTSVMWLAKQALDLSFYVVACHYDRQVLNNYFEPCIHVIKYDLCLAISAYSSNIHVRVLFACERKERTTVIRCYLFLGKRDRMRHGRMTVKSLHRYSF